MAKLTHTQFANLCGIKLSAISVYKQRGKLILGSDGLFDEDENQNAFFIKKRLAKLNGEPIVKEKVVKPKVEIQKPIQEVKPPIPAPEKYDQEEYITDENENDLTKLSFTRLNEVQKIAQIRKLEEEIEKLQKQNAKLDGDNIPTKAVANLFAQHFKSVSINFKNTIENILIELKGVHGFDNEDSARLRDKLVKHLNQSIKDAVKESKESLDIIVEQYSIKKGVGERE